MRYNDVKATPPGPAALPKGDLPSRFAKDCLNVFFDAIDPEINGGEPCAE